MSMHRSLRFDFWQFLFVKQGLAPFRRQNRFAWVFYPGSSQVRRCRKRRLDAWSLRDTKQGTGL
jgi:hypothetical protein